MPTPDDLHSLTRHELGKLGHRNDPDVARLVEEIIQRHGDTVAAVLLYGSYLRGKRDTLLDFYVLLTDLQHTLPPLHALGNRWLPPNVYYLSLPEAALTEGGRRPALRAKYATMTLGQFQRGMDDFHSYFWSRFTQPTGLAWSRDEAAAQRVTDAICAAVHTFVTRVAPQMASPFTSAMLWQQGLALTYRSELRAENPAGVATMYEQGAAHFDGVLDAYAGSPHAVVARQPEGRFVLRSAQTPGWRGRCGWLARRIQGKLLSVARLCKAAVTFDDPLDYLLWKIERHSGIYIEPSARQRRHPLVFAWPLLWRLYRRGAFR
jgi:hypothetical protein